MCPLEFRFRNVEGGEPEENPLKQGREPTTNSTHMTLSQGMQLNLGQEW
jgi:hypothetical protein